MIQQWLNQVDQNTQLFLDHFGHLSNDQLNWKPALDTWSIAQNVDHLIVINSTYFPVLNALKHGTYRTPFVAKFGFLVSFFGKTILDASMPDRRKKMKTLSIWLPAESHIPEGILGRFQEHQRVLKEHIQKAIPFIEKNVVIASPANKYIVYTLSKAFEIIVTHELRHLAQAKDVLKAYEKTIQA